MREWRGCGDTNSRSKRERPQEWQAGVTEGFLELLRRGFPGVRTLAFHSPRYFRPEMNSDLRKCDFLWRKYKGSIIRPWKTYEREGPKLPCKELSAVCPKESITF